MTDQNTLPNFQDDPNYQRFSKNLRSTLSSEQIDQLWQIFQDAEIASTLLQTHTELSNLTDELLNASVQSFEQTSDLNERMLKLVDRLGNAKLHVMDREKLLRMEKEAEEEKKKFDSDLQFGI